MCWRNGFNDQNVAADAKRVKQEASGRLVAFKQKYKSCPVLQMLRNISAVEELRAKGKGVAGVRLIKMGRQSKYKLEPEGPANAVLGGGSEEFLAAVSMQIEHF